jgi:hypothetical protein
MKVSRHELYRIIVEEYARDIGIDESKVDDLIAHIKGGPKPDWMGDDERKIPPPPTFPRLTFMAPKHKLSRPQTIYQVTMHRRVNIMVSKMIRPQMSKTNYRL